MTEHEPKDPDQEFKDKLMRILLRFYDDDKYYAGDAVRDILALISKGKP